MEDEKFPICLAVLTQYRSLTDRQMTEGCTNE